MAISLRLLSSSVSSYVAVIADKGKIDAMNISDAMLVLQKMPGVVAMLLDMHKNLRNYEQELKGLGSFEDFSKTLGVENGA